MMTKLSQLQQGFQRYLLEEEITDISKMVVKDHIPIRKRLNIYFDGYRLRLKEILEQEYPKTTILLGDILYEKAFAAYLDKYPSGHFSVRYFGQHFSQFLKNTPPYRKDAIYTEMARFEWLLGSTLDAKDGKIVTLNQLAQLSENDWPTLTLRFHPSAQFTTFEWDTPLLWKTIDDDAPPRPAVKLNTPQAWLIWRKGLTSLYQSLTPEEATLYQLFSEGLCLAEVLESLSLTMPVDEVPNFAVSRLKHWVSEELITSLSR